MTYSVGFTTHPPPIYSHPHPPHILTFTHTHTHIPRCKVNYISYWGVTIKKVNYTAWFWIVRKVFCISLKMHLLFLPRRPVGQLASCQNDWSASAPGYQGGKRLAGCNLETAYPSPFLCNLLPLGFFPTIRFDFFIIFNNLSSLWFCPSF